MCWPPGRMSHITPHKDIALMTAKPYAPARGCGYFRWPYRHADRLVRLLVRGFLLVFCCNPSVEMHRFRARDMGQTDRQTDGRTDGRIAALLSPREPWPQYGCGYHAIYIVSNCCLGGSVAECLACRTQARKGVGSNRSRDALW